MVQIRWLGAAGIEVSYEGQTLLLDPYVSRVSMAATLFARLKPDELRISEYLAGMPGRAVAIAAGHTHFDHALDIPRLVAKTGAQAFGGRSLRNLLEAAGVGERSVEIRRGATYGVGPFLLRPLISRHGTTKIGTVLYPGQIGEKIRLPLRVGGYRHGLVLAWEVEVGGRRLLHLGSADFIEPSLTSRDVDVLIPCAVGRQNRPEFTRDLLSMTRPKSVIPIHFDNFWARISNGEVSHLPGVDVEGFASEIQALSPTTKVTIPTPFVPIEV